MAIATFIHLGSRPKGEPWPRHNQVASLSAGEIFADINKALDERTIGHNPERLNLMKGGIVYSNRVTTVSPSYAEEARTGGAAGYLRTLINEPHVSEKFSGVLNGIDTAFWCPSTDPLIPAPFNAECPEGSYLRSLTSLLVLCMWTAAEGHQHYQAPVCFLTFLKPC
jgi:glycogen synthase